MEESASIEMQRVHRAMPRHPHHLEHGSAGLGGAGQEAGAQAVAGEVGGVQTKAALKLVRSVLLCVPSYELVANSVDIRHE